MRLLTRAEVAAILRCHPRTLARGWGPGPLQHTGARVLYDSRDVEAWIGRKTAALEAGGGFIYFVGFGEAGPVKIGYSAKKVWRRISNIQCGCPYKIRVFLITRGSEHDEQQIHLQLVGYRMRGEWFRADAPFLEVATAMRLPVYFDGSVPTASAVEDAMRAVECTR